MGVRNWDILGLFWSRCVWRIQFHTFYKLLDPLILPLLVNTHLCLSNFSMQIFFIMKKDSGHKFRNHIENYSRIIVKKSICDFQYYFSTCKVTIISLWSSSKFSFHEVSLFTSLKVSSREPSVLNVLTVLLFGWTDTSLGWWYSLIGSLFFMIIFNRCSLYKQKKQTCVWVLTWLSNLSEWFHNPSMDYKNLEIQAWVGS